MTNILDEGIEYKGRPYKIFYDEYDSEHPIGIDIDALRSGGKIWLNRTTFDKIFDVLRKDGPTWPQPQSFAPYSRLDVDEDAYGRGYAVALDQGDSAHPIKITFGNSSRWLPSSTVIKMYEAVVSAFPDLVETKSPAQKPVKVTLTVEGAESDVKVIS